MSLLEDVFLEDEASEAQELERIIEGDDYDEAPRAPDSNENSEKEDEAEEDKRQVDPSSAKPKRIIKNPRVVLNPARLTGPRGIQVIPDHFKDFKFRGKGHEKEDLDLILKKLEHWAYRLFPKFEFKDCLKKIETLGNKRPVMVHLTKIRSGQLTTESEDLVVQQDSDDEPPEQPEQDEFDKLLQQQIELARATPGPASARKGFNTHAIEKSLTMPKVTSSPSINEEQRERMLRNRQLAEERRLARLKKNDSETALNNATNSTDNTTHPSNTGHDNSTYETQKENSKDNLLLDDRNVSSKEETLSHTSIMKVNTDEDAQDINVTITKAKHNRPNVINSSDSDDDGGLIINESVTVDVHNGLNYESDGISDDEHHQVRTSDADLKEKNEDIKSITDHPNGGNQGSYIDHQNENDQDSYSGHQSQKEQRLSELDHQVDSGNDTIPAHNCQNKRKFEDIENHDSSCSELDLQNKNTEEFVADRDYDESDDIGYLNKTSYDKQTTFGKINRSVAEIHKNNVLLKSLELNDNSTVVSKEINETDNHIKNPDGSVENNKVTDKNREMVNIDDIMDVDFSDDF